MFRDLTTEHNKAQPNLKLLCTACKIRHWLCEWDFSRAGQWNPLLLVLPVQDLCLLCVCWREKGRRTCADELSSPGCIKTWFIWVWKEVRPVQFSWLPPCISFESLRIGGAVIFPFHCGSQCLKTGELFFLGSWLLHCPSYKEQSAPV